MKAVHCADPLRNQSMRAIGEDEAGEAEEVRTVSEEDFAATGPSQRTTSPCTIADDDAVTVAVEDDDGGSVDHDDHDDHDSSSSGSSPASFPRATGFSTLSSPPSAPPPKVKINPHLGGANGSGAGGGVGGGVAVQNGSFDEVYLDGSAFCLKVFALNRQGRQLVNSFSLVRAGRTDANIRTLQQQQQGQPQQGSGSAGGGGGGGGGRHFEATPVFLLRGGDQLRSRSAVEVLSLDVTAEALDEELEARLLELGRPLPSEVIIIRERHNIIIIIIIFHYSFIIAIMIVTKFLVIITVIVASHAILQGCDLRANVVGAKASPDRRRRRVNASVSSSYQQNHQLVLSILRFA